MYNNIDYEMIEGCDECIHSRAVIRVLYSRGDSEVLCQRCYISVLRDIISRHQDRSIVDLVTWVSRFTGNIEILNNY